MNMTDPIADMLTRIRNAAARRKSKVEMPSSKIKKAIAKVMKEEGYIENYEVTDSVLPTLMIQLKYFEGQSVINRIERVSRSSLRVYASRTELPKVDNGLGVAIMSTPKGVMSSREAGKYGQGGEVLCYIS